MTQRLQKIETKEAPTAIGPYSQGIAISAGQPMLFISGQLPVDPKTGKLVDSIVHTELLPILADIDFDLEKYHKFLAKTFPSKHMDKKV